MKMKHYSLMGLALVLSLASCGGQPSDSSVKESTSVEDTSSYSSLQMAFYNLKQNNFTVDMTQSFDGESSNSRKYYTDYALQSEGSQGFSGIAKKDDLIFRYTITDGEVVSSAPLISYDTGMRYDSIFEYTYGMQDFDVTVLDQSQDSDGYYTYEYGRSKKNDDIFSAIFLSRSISGDIYPESVRIKVVGKAILIDSTIITYSGPAFGDKTFALTVLSNVYDVGTTENTDIKQYLDTGKGAKTPLDNNFYRAFAPYLNCENYTIYGDGSQLKDYSSYRLKQYFTEDAFLEEYPTTGERDGYLLSQGIVSAFETRDGKLNITGAPYADSDLNFYTSLYGGLLTSSFGDISFDNFIGYIDETQEDTYVITDSQFIYTLSYLCNVSIMDEMYASKAYIHITDVKKGDFEITFPFYNKLTMVDLGSFKATFSDRNTTVIPEVSRYLKKGDDPTKQNKDQLSKVLQDFKKANYSLDISGSLGLIHYYYTPDCFYAEAYQDKTKNYGYAKKGDSIYEFNLVDGVFTPDMNKDYATGTNPMTMPGCGQSFSSVDDLFYFSAFSDKLYDLDSYQVKEVNGQTYWELEDPSFAKATLDYFTGGTTKVLPMGSGFLFSDEEGDERITLIVNFIAADGSYENAFSFTFYDIGTTKLPFTPSFPA